MQEGKVSVVMITYGHENYIAEAIEGVLMQECNFEVELIIANDCSPDRTNAIVQNYIKGHPKGHLINYYHHSNNIGMMANFVFALKKAKGQYIALCEGDDYCIDPLKLQKQFDILENHNEYSLIYSKVKVYEDKNDQFLSDFGSEIISLEQLINYSTIPTLSTCFRKDILDEYITEIRPLNKEWKMGDYPLWIYIYKKSKIFFLNEITGVYRKLEHSASHTSEVQNSLIFMNSCVELRLFFCNEYEKRKFHPLIYGSHFASVCNLLLSQDSFDKKLYQNESSKVGISNLKIFILKSLMNLSIGRTMLKVFWKI
jgi:glycosyltransferase involved in cell wall biosynthesis